MVWAVATSLFGCGGHHPVAASTVAAPAPGADAASRAWALRAWVAEARGDVEEAERSWRWVARLDRGPWSRVHQGDHLRRQGSPEARAAYADAIEADPSNERARFGLALASGRADLVEPWIERFPCVVATEGPVSARTRAEALCIAR